MPNLYIAYGSNLNIKQMKYRCPTAKLVGNGRLENYIMDFRKILSNAYATIHPQNGGFVPVGFWEIDRIAEQALDIYEGYPQFYIKSYLNITLPQGISAKAMVYIMNKSAIPGIPSPYYIKTIYQGYLDVGINTTYLANICENCGFSLEQHLIKAGQHPH